MNEETLKRIMKEAMEESEAVKEDLEEEENEEEEVEESSVEGKVDVEELADKFADSIVKALGDKVGNEKDKKQFKEKFFNTDNGYQFIKYPTDLSSLTKEEKIVTYFKSLVMHRDDPEANRVMKALVEGTDAQGGYLVPEELRAEVWRILPDFSVMRRLARVIPMNTDTLKLNTLTAKPEAYWTAEYASKTTSSAEFSQVTLSPNKLVCLLPVSQELVADANINIVNFIVELFAERIATIEDKAYFTGSGSGQPTGLMGALGTSVNAGGVSFNDVIDLIYSVPQAIRQSRRTAFVAPSTVIKYLRKLTDSQSRPIWEASHPDNGDPERLYGYPLYEQNSLAHNQMVFGDFSYYVIGDRQTLTVMTTTEGGDAWRRDSVEIKAKIRVDGKTLLTTAFAKMINA